MLCNQAWQTSEREKVKHLVRTYNDRPPPLHILSHIYLLLHLPPCRGARSRRLRLTTQSKLNGIERRLSRALPGFEMQHESLVLFCFFLAEGGSYGEEGRLEEGGILV